MREQASPEAVQTGALALVQEAHAVRDRQALDDDFVWLSMKRMKI